jgi:hypothetical protein
MSYEKKTLLYSVRRALSLHALLTRYRSIENQAVNQRNQSLKKSSDCPPLVNTEPKKINQIIWGEKYTSPQQPEAKKTHRALQVRGTCIQEPGAAQRSMQTLLFCRNSHFLFSWISLKEARDLNTPEKIVGTNGYHCTVRSILPRIRLVPYG